MDFLGYKKYICRVGIEKKRFNIKFLLTGWRCVGDEGGDNENVLWLASADDAIFWIIGVCKSATDGLDVTKPSGLGITMLLLLLQLQVLYPDETDELLVMNAASFCCCSFCCCWNCFSLIRTISGGDDDDGDDADGEDDEAFDELAALSMLEHKL